MVKTQEKPRKRQVTVRRLDGETGEAAIARMALRADIQAANTDKCTFRKTASGLAIMSTR